ncbi:hypothetical protein Plo01_21730 [Planobispora longispora]|uniref:CDP-alcohol phosphatidyltransferase n=2 Tax=Planobispora longispora TaxID=28887 RepID=A0A8J3RLD6_9ACTN|nr:hypothetical protein GCM10020093_089710 [Planobispora longispora]GIH75744.1 hypothetical protein Plo01_21730 [Planobispora longispora]
MDDVHAVRKPRDSWWTVFLVDPVACRLTLLVADRTAITPNGLTGVSMALGVTAAISFALGQLAAGAALFYLSFMVDCTDGKIARLKGTGTPFGLWVDYMGDRIRVICCAAGLASGQYAVTGDVAYILLGAGVTVLDLFRYVNAPQMKRVREVVRENRAQREPAGEHLARQDPAGENRVPCDPGPAEVAAVLNEAAALIREASAQPHPGAHRVLRLYRRIGRFLGRHRVRPHLMSGIEFHAAVFVAAPLLGSWALLPVSTGAGALLLLNEIFLIYVLWLSTRTAPASPIPQRLPV